MKPSKPGSEAEALAMLKIAQIGLELDALTGGWFMKHLPPKRGMNDDYSAFLFESRLTGSNIESSSADDSFFDPAV